MVRLVIIYLLGCLYLASGELLRSKEHIKRREHFLKNAEFYEQEFEKEFSKFIQTGNRTNSLNRMLNALKLDRSFAYTEVEDMPPELAFMSCAVCRLTAATYISQRRNGATAESLANAAIVLCGELTPFPEYVCRPIVEQNLDILIYIIDNNPGANAAATCSLVFQGECNGADPSLDFTVDVIAGPTITQPKSQFTPRRPDELKIVHLSDLHFDPRYLEGGWATCPEIVCCRQDRGIAPNPIDRAGRWGDYRDCGSPWTLVQEIVSRIREAHPDVNYIYYTGDTIDHGHWQRTMQGNRDIMSRVYDAFRSNFGGIPVYSVLGNHESHPVNVFAPPTVTNPSLRTQWLYDFSADQWSSWLPASALGTVRTGGYYTVLLQPGLRLVGINNNDCATGNFWILHTRDNIRSQLQWFHDTLLAAERAGERVHVLSHLHQNSCFRFYSREFRRIQDRFHMTISATFMGHTHSHEFHLFYDRPTNNHAVSVQWNGGSSTPWQRNNPNYVLYHVDRQLFQVNEVETYTYSVAEANATPANRPRWFKLVSFAEFFGIPNLSPASLNQFVERLARSRSLLHQFWLFKIKESKPRIEGGCNDDCLRSQLCAIVQNEFDDNRRCNQLVAIFNANN